ncbi:cyclase family protein [Algivirga pacifica]
MKKTYALSLSLLILLSCQSTSFPDEESWIDLTHSLDQHTIYWPTEPGTFHLDPVYEGETEGGYYYSAYKFCMPEHGGTHMDAPVHFAEGNKSVDQIEIKQLIGEGIVVDLSDKAHNNPDYLISEKDLEEWFKKEKVNPTGKIILFYTGHESKWSDRADYLGTPLKGEEAVPNLHFPGLSEKGALWLVNVGAKAVGLDTPSIDYGQSKDFMAHRVLFAANIPAFENLTNLKKIADQKVYVIALPSKIGGGSGAPLRVIATPI